MLDVIAERKALSALAENVDLKIILTDSFQPSTDGQGTLYLPKSIFDPRISERNFKIGKYCCRHEGYHNLSNQESMFKFIRWNKLDMRTFLGMLYNILWDEINDRLACQRYRGSRQIMNIGRALFVEDYWSLSVMKDHKKEIENNILNVILAWDVCNRITWNKHMEHLPARYIETLTEEEITWLEELYEHDFYKELVYISTNNAEERGKSVWNLLQRMLKVFPYEIPDKEQPPEDYNGEVVADEKEAGEGEKEPTEIGTESGTDASEDIHKSKETNDKENKDLPDKIAIDYEQFMVSHHDSDANSAKEKAETVASSYVKYDNYKGRREYIPYTLDETTIVDYETGVVTSSSLTTEGRENVYS